MIHDCPGPECHPYPTFDDDPSRWRLREPEMTEAEAGAEARAAEELELWGPDGAPTWAEWAAEAGSHGWVAEAGS